MVLYFVGLGLGDEKDITVKGLEVVKRCDKVFLEAYTAILGVEREKLEEFYGRPVIEADRDLVEQAAEVMLKAAETTEVAFLVVGDPFGATTHTDLYMRAVDRGIKCEVIHNASIMNAAGACGLQLYNFGQTVSICFFSENWRPDSFYNKIKRNVEAGFHTMCLLDIKVKEQSRENMAKDIKVFEPPRYMTVNQCIEQLLEIEERRGEKIYSPDSPCIGLSRVGHADQQIIAGSMKELVGMEFGAPLHTVVIPGDMHFIEEEMYEFWHWNRANRASARRQKIEADEAARVLARTTERNERKAVHAAKLAADKAVKAEAKAKADAAAAAAKAEAAAAAAAAAAAPEDSSSEEENAPADDGGMGLF